MDCDGFEQRIGDYLDQGLTIVERQDFCRHLLACPPCRELFDEIRDNLALCRLALCQIASSDGSDTGPGTVTRHSAPERAAPVVEHLPPASADHHHPPAGAIAPIGDLISCRTLDLLISDFFDDETDDPVGFDSAAIDHHLDSCADCRVLLNGLRQASAGSGGPEGERFPANAELPELESRIMALTVGGSR